MAVNSRRLGEESVHKLMFSFGIFAIIAMLATGGQNVASALIISRGIEVHAMGVMGLLFPLVTVYFGFSQLVAIGAASYISRMLGKDKKTEVRSAVVISYLLTLLISGLLMVGTQIFKENILAVLGTDVETVALARTYLTMFIYSIPFTAMVLLSSAIFRAYGKLKLSMLVVLIDAFLIVALDYLFVYVLRSGIEGVALSNLLTGVFASALGIYLIIGINPRTPANKWLLKWEFSIVTNILNIGLSALGRSLAGATFSLMLNHMINQLGGADSLAALGVVNRILQFLLFSIMGISQAMQPIVSYNFTAKKSNRVKTALKYGLLYSGLIGLVGSFLGIFLPHQVVRIFTSNTDVLDDAALIFRMQLAFFFTIGLQTLTATYFQAIGKAWMSFFLSVFKPLLLLIPLIYFLPNMMAESMNTIWWAFPVSDVFATLICFLLLRKGVKELVAVG